MELTQRSATTAERIMNTTFDLLASRGYAGVSMRDIAQEAGVSVGQIAYHYGSKEKLIAQVVGRVADRCAEELERLLDEKHIMQERLETITAYFGRLHDENAQLFRVLLDFMGQSIWVPAYREELNKFFLRVTKMLTQDILPPVQQEGDGSVLDQLSLMGNAFFSYLIGSVFRSTLGFDLGVGEGIEGDGPAPTMA